MVGRHTYCMITTGLYGRYTYILRTICMVGTHAYQGWADLSPKFGGKDIMNLPEAVLHSTKVIKHASDRAR